MRRISPTRRLMTALAAVWFLLHTADADADQPAVAASAGHLALYGGEIRFDILRDGEKVGHHLVQFAPKADGIEVTSRSEIEVTLLFLTAYRFGYQSIEHWRDGSLVRLHAATNDNGDFTSIEAKREGERLKVTTNGTAWQGPPQLLPTTHWNMAQTRTPAVLNTLTGKLNQVRVSDAGLETVILDDGPRQARRFVYSGDLSVESWYDLDGRWVMLRFPAKDGSTIEYLCSSCGSRTAMTESE